MIGNWRKLPRKIRFLFCGGFNTVAGFLIFVGLQAALHGYVNYLVVAALSHCLAVVVAYLTQRYAVFDSAAPWLGSFFRFALSQAVAFGIGIVSLYVLVTYGRLHPIAAQGIITVVLAVATYVVHRRFSFRHQPAGLDAPGDQRSFP